MNVVLRNKLVLLVVLIGCALYLNGVLYQDTINFAHSETQVFTPLHAIAEFLGEFRTTIASYLWIQSDLYHHEWEDEGKDWKQNQYLLSFCRLITILDPHFEQAYDFGGYFLVINMKRVDQGIQFLREGLQNNPDSYDINFSLGYSYYTLKNYDAAMRYFKKCFHVSRNAVDKKIALRNAFYSSLFGKNAEGCRWVIRTWNDLFPEDTQYVRFLEERLKDINKPHEGEHIR